MGELLMIDEDGLRTRTPTASHPRHRGSGGGRGGRVRTNNTIAILGALTGLLMGCGDCYEACQLDADLYVKCNDGMNKSMLCIDDETEAPTRPCWSRADVVESCGIIQEKVTGILGDQYECWDSLYDPEGLRDALREGDCCAATALYHGFDPDVYEDPDDCGTLGEW